MEQREMPLIAEVGQPEMLPMSDVQRCADDQAAIQLCWERRRVRKLTQHRAAKLLGMDPGNFSRALHQGPFPSNKRGRLMAICGNYAPLQFEAWKRGLGLCAEDPKERRIRELQNELQQLRGVA